MAQMMKTISILWKIEKSILLHHTFVPIRIYEVLFDFKIKINIYLLDANVVRLFVKLLYYEDEFILWRLHAWPFLFSIHLHLFDISASKKGPLCLIPNMLSFSLDII